MRKVILSYLVRWITTAFFEIKGMLSGKDNKLSIRRVMATICLYKFLNLDCSLGAVNDAYVWALITFIAALLSLTTFQSMKENGDFSSGS